MLCPQTSHAKRAEWEAANLYKLARTLLYLVICLVLALDRSASSFLNARCSPYVLPTPSDYTIEDVTLALIPVIEAAVTECKQSISKSSGAALVFTK